jgi:acid phosphatase (class A)
MMLMVVGLVAFGVIESNAQQYKETFLTDDNRPQALEWLPDPPELTAAEFVYDFYFYQWGRSQRVEGISEQALSDESADLKDVFAAILGIKLSYETTPEILKLAECATNDAHLANKVVKDHYKRVRPFAQFKEPSLKPWTDPEEAETYSFPSGHSSRGWMYALTLASIAPEKATELFMRARDYAINRIICGHHWKTDIDASMMLAAGIFATVVSTKEYQEQMAKARAEYLREHDGETSVNANKAEAPNEAAIYDLQGRRLDSAPTSSGIYIQNGQKTVVK